MIKANRNFDGLSLCTVFLTRAALNASISLESHCLQNDLHPVEAADWLCETTDNRDLWIDVRRYLCALDDQQQGTAVEIMLKKGTPDHINTMNDISRLPQDREKIQYDLDAFIPF